MAIRQFEYMAQEALGSLDIRIPRWEDNDLEDVPCPLCRSESRDVIRKRPDGLVVNLCSRCGLLFVSPRPSDLALAKFYSDYMLLHGRGDYRSEDYWMGIRNSQYALATSDPRILFLVSHGIKIRGMRVLDVGCGNGSFLLKCRRLGASSVVGVEPEKKMANAAKSHLDIEVYDGYLENMPEDKGLFDLVVLWDVLEHLSDPCRVMRQIVERLEPDGAIAAMTPNAGGFRTEGMGWTGFRVDFEHVCYYTKEVAAFLFSSADCHLVTATPFGYPVLDDPARTGKNEGWANSFIFPSVRRAPFLAATLTKLYSIMPVVKNKGRNSLGSYHLFLLGRKGKGA